LAVGRAIDRERIRSGVAMLPLETAHDVGRDENVAMELEVLSDTALMQIWASGEFNPGEWVPSSLRKRCRS